MNATNLDAAIADEAVNPIIHAQHVSWSGSRQLELVDSEVTLSRDRGPTRRTEAVLRVGRIAAVLPYDARRNRLLVLRQFRAAAHLAHGRGANIEVIAGRAEPGEDIVATARRETLEEAGVDLHDLEPVLEFMPAPSALEEQATLFLARADLGAVPAVGGSTEEQETTLPILVRPDVLLSAACEGRVRNGYTLIAILWFMMHRDDINARFARMT